MRWQAFSSTRPSFSQPFSGDYFLHFAISVHLRDYSFLCFSPRTLYWLGAFLSRVCSAGVSFLSSFFTFVLCIHKYVYLCFFYKCMPPVSNFSSSQLVQFAFVSFDFSVLLDYSLIISLYHFSCLQSRLCMFLCFL